jgi:hypothetical protein
MKYHSITASINTQALSMSFQKSTNPGSLKLFINNKEAYARYFALNTQLWNEMQRHEADNLVRLRIYSNEKFGVGILCDGRNSGAERRRLIRIP